MGPHIAVTPELGSGYSQGLVAPAHRLVELSQLGERKDTPDPREREVVNPVLAEGQLLDRGPLDGAGRARGGSPRQRIVLTYGFHRLTIIAARVERPCAHDVAREMRAGIRQLDRNRTCLLGVLGRAVEVAD